MEWLFLPVLKGSQRNPDYLPALMPSAAGQAT
jgi:hypothetical protein